MATKSGELIKGAFRGAMVDLIAEHYGKAGSEVLELGEAGPRELLAAMEKGYHVFIDAVEDMILRTGGLLEGTPVELIKAEHVLSDEKGPEEVPAGASGVFIEWQEFRFLGTLAQIRLEDGRVGIFKRDNVRRKKELNGPKKVEPKKPATDAGPAMSFAKGAAVATVGR